MTSLLVTFLYNLNKEKLFKNKGRSWEGFYIPNFDALCQEIHKQNRDLLVFSDDSSIKAVVDSYPNIRYIYSELGTFKEYQRLELMKETKARRLTWDVENPIYNCLQNCKFEALYRASILWPHQNLAWIDGGLRDPKQNFEIKWAADDRIRACADNSVWGRNEIVVSRILGGTSIMGGCFGGSVAAIRWLCDKTYEAQTDLLNQGSYTNDQGLLTLLAYKYPNRFLLKPQYELYFGLYSKGFWHNVTHCLDDGIRGNLYYHYTTLFLLPVFVLVCCYYLNLL